MSRIISKSTEDDIIKILAKSSHPVDKTVDSTKKKMTSQSETIMRMAPKASNTIKRGHGLQVDPAPGYGYSGYGLKVNGRGPQVNPAPSFGYGLQIDTISGRGIIDPRKKNDLYANNYM